MAEPTLGASTTAGPLGAADATPGPPPPVAFFGSRRAPAEPSAASAEGRPLRQYERAAAHAVFRDALKLDGIRIKESAVMSVGGYYRTLPEKIYIIPRQEIPLRILIHELTHAAQYQHGVAPIQTIALAIVGIVHDVYNYGGEAGLRKGIAERKCFTDFSFEQQGDIVQHYFERLIAGQKLYPWSIYIEQVRAGFKCVWPADTSEPPSPAPAPH